MLIPIKGKSERLSSVASVGIKTEKTIHKVSMSYLIAESDYSQLISQLSQVSLRRDIVIKWDVLLCCPVRVVMVLSLYKKHMVVGMLR